jgi:hypothetical protein
MWGYVGGVNVVVHVGLCGMSECCGAYIWSSECRGTFIEIVNVGHMQ